jgi:hypothetical protein
LLLALHSSNPLTGGRRYDEEEWKQTLGFTLEDVDQSICAGIPPTSYYEAVRGPFSREDVENAVKTGPLNDMLEILSYQGHEFYSWGEDNAINLSLRSNVRPVGRGHRLAHIDDFIFWTSWTDGIRGMIDSREGNIESLADVEDYRLLAEALEELDVCYAFFSSESQSHSSITEWREQTPQGFSSEQHQRFLESLEDPVHLEPYQAFATGAGLDQRGFYMAIVLVNPSEAVARSNATLLEQRVNRSRSVWRGFRWSDLVESIEIRSKGELTLAKLYGAMVEYWDSFDMHSEEPYEPLLLHD